MTFELTEYNEAKLAKFTKRVEHHGDEEKQAVSLGLEITDANTILDRIDPTLRPTLYRAVDEDQGELPEVDVALPVLRSNSIDKTSLPQKYEGWTLQIERNGNEDEDMRLGGCKLTKFTVEPKQGGSVVLRFTVGTSDLDADRLGWLGMQHGASLWIKLHAPKAQEPAIDGSKEGGGPGFSDDEQPDAGQLFAAEHAEA